MRYVFVAWQKLCPIVGSALLAFWAAAAAAQKVVPNELSISVNRAYSPAVTAAIARLGRPTGQVLEPGQTIRDAIVKRCGTFDATYLAAFLKENGIAAAPDDLASLRTGVTYQFPACLYSTTTERRVKDKENPSTIYSALGVPFAAATLKDAALDRIPPVTKPLQIGIRAYNRATDKLSALVTAARGFDGTEAARTFADRNSDIEPTKLNIDGQSTLYVPSSQRSGIIELREGTSVAQAKQELMAAINALTAAQGAPQPTEIVGPTAGSVSDVTLADLIDTVSYNGACTWKDGSPISLTDLRNARAENNRLRGKLPLKAKVLVIDTGYDERLWKSAIPEDKLGNLAAFHSDDDPRHYHGFNPVDQDRYNDPTPPAGLPSATHGGEVAATMLGGRFLIGLDRSAVPMEVTFASLAKGKLLRAEGANAAVEFAAQQDINIVNASFVARSPYQDFLRVLKESTPPLLVITAAGNDPGGDGWFAPEDSSWPGRLGGNMAFDNSPALILSVGAHGPNGELLSFSKKGRDHVDLLAPGCRIPTLTLADDGTVAASEPSGTSFAAPIVTLIASELFSEGLSPIRIRNRILASVDIDQSLDGVVWSSGTLNVRKALSVYRDFIEFSRHDPETGMVTTEIVSGTLTNGADQVVCGGSPMPYATIDKFAFARSRSNLALTPKNYVFLRPSPAGGRYLKSTSCSAAELANAKPLLFINANGGVQVSVQLADVIDFVARSFTPEKKTN